MAQAGKLAITMKATAGMTTATTATGMIAATTRMTKSTMATVIMEIVMATEATEVMKIEEEVEVALAVIRPSPKQLGEILTLGSGGVKKPALGGL